MSYDNRQPERRTDSERRNEADRRLADTPVETDARGTQRRDGPRRTDTSRRKNG